MRKGALRLWCAVFAALLPTLAYAAGGDSPRGPQWSILHKSDTGLSLSFVMPDPLWIKTETGGRRADISKIKAGQTLPLTETPHHVFTFLLPAYASLNGSTVSLELAEWVDAESGRPLPLEGEAPQQWRPVNAVAATEVIPYGGYKLLRVTVVTLSYDVERKRVRALRSGMIHVQHAPPGFKN